jgi:hypothetical protein
LSAVAVGIVSAQPKLSSSLRAFIEPCISIVVTPFIVLLSLKQPTI